MDALALRDVFRVSYRLASAHPGRVTGTQPVAVLTYSVSQGAVVSAPYRR